MRDRAAFSSAVLLLAALALALATSSAGAEATGPLQVSLHRARNRRIACRGYPPNRTVTADVLGSTKLLLQS